MSISRVFEICNAYESGVGHGVKKDGLTGGGIFTDAELTEAFKLGYDEGSQQEIEDGAASDVVCPNCGDVFTPHA